MRKLTKNSNNLIQTEMKIIFKKPLWFTVITTLCLAITLFATFGCDKSEVPDKEKQVYPITIDMINFSLSEGCAWDNLMSDSMYLINSQEELTQHLAYYANAVLNVDLDKYSLIVLQPKNCNIDSKVEKLLLQQMSANKYLLSADVIPSLTTNATPLVISVLVPKISETALVEMAINRNNLNTNSLIGTWREIYPCEDCSSLTFSDNDTIYHQFTYDNSIVKLTYQFISEDSIQIERLQESETNPYTRKTNNRIFFYNGDSILIEKFYVSDAAVFPPEFIDIKLLKTR